MYIDNDGYRYSLCIAEKSKKDSMIYYRIADLDETRDKLIRAYYTEPGDMVYGDYMPLRIYNKPGEIIEHHVELRKWKWDAYSQKQWSYVADICPVTEIYFPEEINYKKQQSLSKIQDVLSKGIRIDDYIHNEFLLPINDCGEYYEMLFCKKNDFQLKNGLYYISDTVSDMLHTKHVFLKYRIDKADILDTTVVKDSFYAIDFNIFEKDRLFYAKYELGNPISKVTIRNIDAYIAAFLRWYLKKQNILNSFTNKEISRTISVIDEVKNNDKELQEFFADIEMDVEEVKSFLQKQSKRVVEFFEVRDDIDDILLKILLNNSDVYENCISVVENRWLNQFSTLREQKEIELNAVTQALRDENNRVSDMQKIILELENKIEDKKEEYLNTKIETESMIQDIRKEIENYELRKESLANEINENLSNFKEDIIQATQILGVQENSKKSSVYANATLNNSLIVIEPVFNNDDSNVIKDIDDFLEDFMENISLNFTEYIEIAGTILSAVLSSRAIIVSDNIALNIANSCAALIDNGSALILDLSAGKDALYEAETILNNCGSTVVYIKGVLDNYDEASFVSLCRHLNNKTLFFGVTTLEKLKLISNGIFNYAITLDIEDKMDFAKNKEFYYGRFKVKDIELPLEKEMLKEYYAKYFKKLVNAKIIGTNNALIFSEMLGYYFILTDTLGYSFLPGENNTNEIGEIFQKAIGTSFNLSTISDEEANKLLLDCGFSIDER